MDKSVLYTDIFSCVLSNGHTSKHFRLEHGVRQGCSLSGTLFVIAIELLAQSIRRSKEMKGITIDERNEVKLCNMQMTQLYFFLMFNQHQNYLIYYRFSKGALV